MKKSLVSDVLATLFVILFAYASITKIMDYKAFAIQIGKSPLLNPIASIVPWMIPGVEIGIVLLLIIPKFRRLAFFASFSLMTMFTVYIVAILNFSDTIPCSCGGILERMTWQDHLVFNLFFVGFALAGILLESIKKSKTTQNHYSINHMQ